MQSLMGKEKNVLCVKLLVNNMLKIIAVGKLKNSALKELYNEYTSRIGQFTKYTTSEIKDSTPTQESRDILLKTKNTTCFFLSPEGKQLSSEKLAQLIKHVDVSFVIGGPNGLSADVKKTGTVLSLSQMTFPHELCRVLLAEQIYRALTILNNHPYHH